MKAHNPESGEFRDSLESNLTYLCTFALEDPLRVDIKDTCQMIRYGHRVEDEEVKDLDETVKIKMISGDHIETCKRVALACGIINEDD